MSQYDSYFYEFHTHPDDPELMAIEAKRYGYSGMVIVNSTVNKEKKIPFDFSIFNGIEIKGKPSRIREEIRKYRDSNNILISKGGDEEFNRAALESDGLDILLQPPQINNVLAKAASDNSIAIGFNLGLLIRLRGDARIRELKNMRTNIIHARKYKLQMILTGDPHSVYDLRSPRELVAISSLFGMKPEEAIDSISTVPQRILQRKTSDYIQEGIEII